jgi:hypothetical protein
MRLVNVNVVGVNILFKKHQPLDIGNDLTAFSKAKIVKQRAGVFAEMSVLVLGLLPNRLTPQEWRC